MSGLQEIAEPLILALGNDDWSNLTADDLSAIASWATMVSMCLEFADVKTQSVSKADRKIFSEMKIPGRNWIVCAGRCQNLRDPGSSWHRAAHLVLNGQVLDAPDRMNTQTTTFVVGSSFIHTLSGPDFALPDPAEYAATLGIRQFWPNPSEPPTAPPHFTKDGLARVATEFWARHGLSRQPHFGHWLR